MVLIFVVRDRGRGISPDHVDRIFEPFTQFPDSDSSFTSGTGLGLTVTRMLANALGARVSVNSRLGDGSTFTFELPSNVISGDSST
jgi:signal transduction histidine kinase